MALEPEMSEGFNNAVLEMKDPVICKYANLEAYAYKYEQEIYKSLGTLPELCFFILFFI